MSGIERKSPITYRADKHARACTCVCVCVCVYLYVLIFREPFVLLHLKKRHCGSVSSVHHNQDVCEILVKACAFCDCVCVCVRAGDVME